MLSAFYVSIQSNSISIVLLFNYSVRWNIAGWDLVIVLSSIHFQVYVVSKNEHFLINRYYLFLSQLFCKADFQNYTIFYKRLHYSCSTLSTSSKPFIKLRMCYLQITSNCFLLKVYLIANTLSSCNACWIICVYQIWFCLAQKKFLDSSLNMICRQTVWYFTKHRL